MGAGGDRFRDVAGMADTPIGDDRHPGAFECLRHLGHGADLRHADAGHHPGRTDRARTHPDLDRIGTGLDQGLGPAAVTTLPPITGSSG